MLKLHPRWFKTGMPLFLLISILQVGCRTKVQDPQNISHWEDAVLPEASADTAQRIEEVRKADFRISVYDDSGKPLPAGTKVHIELMRHDFLFGANFYQWGGLDDKPDMRDAYRERFTDLMNYATLPFYWGWYEAVEGLPDELTHSRETALWCQEAGIEVKGHPLVWHEVTPEWEKKYSDDEMMILLENRVRSIVSDYKGLIDKWDVINESQSSHKFDNSVGRWVKTVGADNAVAESFRWAEESNEEGYFLINDYDVLDNSYAEQINRLVENGTVPDAIGVQSHMHHTEWSDQTILKVYNRLESLNIPIHFTELTVLSGQHMTGFDYSTTRTDWETTAAGENRQAAELVRIYRLLFSLPNVEAITYWDLSDANAWLGAPAGLLRKDMSPKPAYFYLMKLIHDEWNTDITVRLDENSQIAFHGFFGTYTISASGKTAVCELPKNGERSADVVVR